MKSTWGGVQTLETGWEHKSIHAQTHVQLEPIGTAVCQAIQEFILLQLR